MHIGRALCNNDHIINKGRWQNKAMTIFSKLILSMNNVTVRVPIVNKGMVMPNKTLYIFLFDNVYILRLMHDEYLCSSLIIHYL